MDYHIRLTVTDNPRTGTEATEQGSNDYSITQVTQAYHRAKVSDYKMTGVSKCTEKYFFVSRNYEHTEHIEHGVGNQKE